MKRKITQRKPAEWQTDWRNIATADVQFWRNGVMITARMSLMQAQHLVEDGVAFVMTEQAIGALFDECMAS